MVSPTAYNKPACYRDNIILHCSGCTICYIHQDAIRLKCCCLLLLHRGMRSFLIHASVNQRSMRDHWTVAMSCNADICNLSTQLGPFKTNSVSPVGWASRDRNRNLQISRAPLKAKRRAADYSRACVTTDVAYCSVLNYINSM